MGRREIFHTFSLLVEIKGHFTHGFVIYVNTTLTKKESKREKVMQLQKVD
jgi:hypothetical protein